MNKVFPVYTVEAECQDCYKCLRQCPVKAIKVEQGRAAVIPDACIACGRCVEVCPAGAKRIRDDLGRTRYLLNRKKKVYVSLAPSYAGAFPGIPA
ncbi:MAG: 4Fe-4S dicluster domain-containing protein, partial [Kiritimatiellales bacterium]